MLGSLEGVVAPAVSAPWERLGGFGTHYAAVILSSFFRTRNRFTDSPAHRWQTADWRSWRCPGSALSQTRTSASLPQTHAPPWIAPSPSCGSLRTPVHLVAEAQDASACKETSSRKSFGPER